MKAIGELHQHDAKIADHRQQHLSEGLGLLLFLRHVCVAGDFGDAVDELRDVLAKHLLQRFFRGQGVFEDVVQQADRDRGLVEMQVGEDVRNIEWMHQVRLARAAHLPAVLAGREDVGLLQKLLVEVRLVRLQFVEDVFEADHLFP